MLLTARFCFKKASRRSRLKRMHCQVYDHFLCTISLNPGHYILAGARGREYLSLDAEHDHQTHDVRYMRVKRYI